MHCQHECSSSVHLERWRGCSGTDLRGEQDAPYDDFPDSVHYLSQRPFHARALHAHPPGQARRQEEVTDERAMAAAR